MISIKNPNGVTNIIFLEMQYVILHEHMIKYLSIIVIDVNKNLTLIQYRDNVFLQP